ncbi:enoyl-CoA hydratase [Psychrosphaera haliotis]|uniref:Enoyl-CoA hydratase n=1 Tax=Psychrosphaera haliotis TaxID=555083 RepID=A0A6N8F6W7_9GAMM|nr:enoyl-CoA hydratase [Psychrosphaera haliotis]MUH71139.1 enoyl-CoA hydratase [Psychrosphaera haliotis]
MSSLLNVSIEGHIAQVTINNPPANTWTLDSLKELKNIITELNSNKAVYALVLTGQGEKFFSAGADLNIFASGDKGVAFDMASVFGEAFETLRDFNGVTIAAINGYAMGGGLEVALACDIRICEDQAQMALPEAKVGLLPCAGGTQNLSWLVGEGWAKRMILCGERVDSKTALKIGLVEEVVAKGGSLEAAMKLAQQTSQQSPTSITACKQLIQAGRASSINSALPLERELFVNLFNSKDQKEGVNAFLEKRAPVWLNE